MELHPRGRSRPRGWWYGSRLRTHRHSNGAPGAGDAAALASRRAVVFILPALLLSVVAVMMIEQSLRWAATAAVRRHFTNTEFQIDHLRDEPGKGHFALDGHIVSSGEVIHTTVTNAVSLERLRDLEAAGRIPGAREPVHYLPLDAPGAFLDPTIRFRVQEPDMFDIDARGWVVVNVLVAIVAVWLFRRGVRVARNHAPGPPICLTRRLAAVQERDGYFATVCRATLSYWHWTATMWREERTMGTCTRGRGLAITALLSASLGVACGGQEATPSAPATSAAPAPPADIRPRLRLPTRPWPPRCLPMHPSLQRRLPTTRFRRECGGLVDRPSSGDLDEMVKRRAIRVGVTFNRTHYFIDRGQEHGITYEALKSFEKDLNERLKTGNLKVHVVIVPMSRDQLQAALAGGTIDMVAAMVTVRPELEKLAAFSVPTRTNVNQVVVTGPGAPPLATLDDLAGREVFVRKASAYYGSLTQLSTQLTGRGKPAIVIHEAPDVLEDDDILEMVNAGLMPITIVDDYLAQFWQQVFTDIKVHPDLAVRTGGKLAIAFRKENPKLRAAVDEWVVKHGRGDTFRAVIEQRYLQEREVRQERHDGCRAAEVQGSRSSCSGSTGASTTWITC